MGVGISAPQSIGFIDLFERLGVSARQWTWAEWQLLCSLRVAVPGIVQSFNATKQTVTVQVAVMENMLINHQSTPVAINILQDIPIVVPRAGGYSLTLPVQAGDECLVIFTDMCFNSWYQNGGSNNVQEERRRHDLSDGIAVLGCWSQPRVLANYSPNTVQLRDDAGDTYVEVAPSGVVNVVCQTANVNASSQANVTAPTIDLNGNVVVSGDLTVDGTITATMGLTTLENLTVTGTANVVTFNATGTTVLSGVTTIEGKAFLLHTHSGVTTGGGDTGGVV
jgi:phage baseplate assembly protein gpV